jgi:hypothetical protein
MPPISPQGSRTGLVTALVIFVILFVTTTILWIYEGAERRNRDDRIADFERSRREILDDATATGGEVEALKKAATENPAYAGKTAMQVALTQRDELARAVAGGTAASPAQARTRITQVMERLKAPDVAAANPGITPTTPLADAVNGLLNRLAQLNQDLANQTKAVADAKAETQRVIAAQNDLLKQKDDQIAKINQDVQGQMAQIATYRTQAEGTVKAIETSSNTTLTQAQQQNEQLSAQINQANATIKQKDDQIAALQRRLGDIRVNPNEATVQKPDGEIVRLPGNNLAVINLGLGDQIVQGMTFEVYDKYTGIPALGADGTRNEEMPKGKASIEVVRILPGFSECRIIRKEAGHNLVQGDLIANLVYDKTQKYKFVVYGDFDLDGDGRASAGDAEVIRRLITQWGGTISSDVNVNTDFVVMGVEPTLPQRPGPDATAVEQAAYQRAENELNKYLDVQKQAMALQIPILNQNRFLNFVGYASQAGR